jgi:hypothetical protein
LVKCPSGRLNALRKGILFAEKMEDDGHSISNERSAMEDESLAMINSER